MEDATQPAAAGAGGGAPQPTGADRVLENTTAEVMREIRSKQQKPEQPEGVDRESTDVRAVMLASFVKLSNTFVTSAAGVWRGCPVLQRWKQASDAILAQGEDSTDASDALSLFFRAMSPHFTAIENKDASFMVFDDRFEDDTHEEDVGKALMKELSASEKWNLASPQIRETCWQYMKMLCRYATVYTVYEKIPPGMFRTILNVATRLNDRKQQGGIDINQITSQGLMATGNQILDTVDPKEKEEFMRALTDDESSEAMMAALQALVGHMNPMGGGTGDLASMIMQAKAMRR